jgi:calcium/calmodulin-dependent protein kinase I
VRLAVNKITGENKAVKIIDKDKCKGKEGMIDTEVRILQRMDHPNIVKLYEKHQFDNKIYLVMEL